VVDLSAAVAVYRDDNAKLRIDQRNQMTTGEGADWLAVSSALPSQVVA
jgi:hypothetical protein